MYTTVNKYKERYNREAGTIASNSGSSLTFSTGCKRAETRQDKWRIQNNRNAGNKYEWLIRLKCPKQRKSLILSIDLSEPVGNSCIERRPIAVRKAWSLNQESFISCGTSGAAAGVDSASAFTVVIGWAVDDLYAFDLLRLPAPPLACPMSCTTFSVTSLDTGAALVLAGFGGPLGVHLVGGHHRLHQGAALVRFAYSWRSLLRSLHLPCFCRSTLPPSGTGWCHNQHLNQRYGDQ